jgi:hypothetical protein
MARWILASHPGPWLRSAPEARASAVTESFPPSTQTAIGCSENQRKWLGQFEAPPPRTPILPKFGFVSFGGAFSWGWLVLGRTMTIRLAPEAKAAFVPARAPPSAQTAVGFVRRPRHEGGVGSVVSNCQGTVISKVSWPEDDPNLSDWRPSARVDRPAAGARGETRCLGWPSRPGWPSLPYRLSRLRLPDDMIVREVASSANPWIQ